MQRHVVAILVKDGKPISIGSNYHENCPREGMATGEGYELCLQCSPTQHAERRCIRTASMAHLESNFFGAKMYIYGHSYACASCLEWCSDRGIEIIITGKEWSL